MIVRFWSVLCLGILAASTHGALGNNDNEDVPYLELAEPEEGYHGLIRENETLVEVTPPIRARGPLCSFLILNNKHHGEEPFEIMVIDENEARLRVRFPLNCEKRRNYKFDIAAVGCDGSYSNTVPVHITVTDVNEFAPTFTQASYSAAVDEGRLYEQVARVAATDRDCTPRFGDVCTYHILNDSSAQPAPFAIDNDGVIRNTEPLDYERANSHELSVVAYDCGMKPSAPVTVTIKVNKPCRAGWKGVAERVEYAAGSGPLKLFPEARLEACQSDARCPGVTRIRAAVSLQAARAPAACDRDTYALHAQRAICGLDPNTVDLLPSPGVGNEWAKSLKLEPGHESEALFSFDGSTSAVVPEPLLPHSLGSTFSVSGWLRHAPAPDHDKHRKEHLLCLADDHKMNRHHYALFVRNCRLILLLRRDFGDGDLNIFRPAEWRWKIPQVCDNEWHHYAINVRFPSVELVVDGEPHRAADGVDVIDDWPLHPAHGLNTTMVVGACWQGTEGDMKHHLSGALAGLGVLRGAVQPARALRCVAQCREGLSLAPDLYLPLVSVEGDGVADVETLLRRVTYADARADPTPGRRNVHVDTTITCDNGRVLRARGVEAYVMVLQPVTPAVLLAGGGGAARDYAAFRAGLPVYPDLSVSLLHPPAGRGKLDSCVVSVYPALNPDHEALTLRGEGGGEGGEGEGDALRYDIRAQVTRDGVILTGADTHEHYQQVLRQISYSNKKPAYYLNRVFKLTCSELNGRFTSNEYVQTLTVVHPHTSSGASAGEGGARDLQPSGVADKVDGARGAHSGAGAHVVARGYVSLSARAPRPAADLPAHTSRRAQPDGPTHNHVALVMGVVAAGVVVGVACVGLARARRPRPHPRPRGRPAPRSPRADAELAWDDSALTITVNPMEESGGGGCVTSQSCGAAEEAADSDSCSDSDSDSDRHHSDDDDDDTHIPARGPHRYRSVGQLEWDNTTM